MALGSGERVGPNWVLVSGLICALTGVVAACAPSGPLVIPFQPPREPITGLDVVQAGETEFSGNVGAAVTPNIGSDQGWTVEPWAPSLLAPPWSLGLNHGLERLELRVLVGQHFLARQGSVGVGYRLPSAGKWDFIADAALAASRYQSRFEVPRDDYVDTAGGYVEPSDNPSFTARDPGWYAYAYWIMAPSLRARAVWRPNPQLSVPLAVRVAHSRTGFGYGLLDFEQEQENYVELSAGAIWSLSETCLSVGAGVHATVHPYPTVLTNVSLSCDVDWKTLRR